MESIFDKDPAAAPTPTNYERIAPEISHLKKGSSARHGPGNKGKSVPWIALIVICVLLGLYFMDPFLYALRKAEAIRTYLYLHNYGAKSEETALIGTGIFSTNEIEVLNHRQGSFQNYFSSPDQADRQAAAIVNYMNGLRALHEGNDKDLGPVGKLRCLLFIRTGIPLPMDWSGLDPSVND